MKYDYTYKNLGKTLAAFYKEQYPMKAILTSKKFQAAIAGVVVAVLGKVGLDLDTESILAILSPILTYIAGQGLADIGKEAAKLKNGN